MNLSTERFTKDKGPLSFPSCAIKILTYVAPKCMTFQCYVSFTFPSTSNGISPPLCAAEPLICSCPCAATQLPLTSLHHLLVLPHQNPAGPSLQPRS